MLQESGTDTGGRGPDAGVLRWLPGVCPPPARSSAAWLAAVATAALVALACDAPRESAPVRGASADPREALTLVVVGAFPGSAIAEMEPLVQWLNERLAGDRLRVGVRVATSVPEAAARLAAGEADFYLDSPHPILLARHLSGCRPILRRWKFGSPTYHSVLFTRDDSGIRSLEDLLGRPIAFEDRYSSSSFFLPVDLLLSGGFDYVFLDAAHDPVPADRMGFVFSGGDSNTMHWVLAGKVAAGAMNPWNLERLAAEERHQLRVLATTDDVPRHLLAVRSNLDPALEARVRDLLLAAHESPSGREMLAAFSATERFDDVPREFLAAMDHIQESVVLLDERVRSSLASPAAP